MTEKNNGPEEAVKGVVKKAPRARRRKRSVASPAVMTWSARARLSGDKANAQRDAAKKEAEAEAARGGAKAAEERQSRSSNPPRLAKGSSRNIPAGPLSWSR